MGNRKTSGVTKRGRNWHLNKQFRGVRIRGSAATTSLTDAVELLASRIEGVRQSQLYGSVALACVYGDLAAIRLRAAGVSFEDRQDLLGHKSQRITTHYSHPELSNLIAAAEKACG